MLFRMLLVLLVTAVAIGGCGRRGGLEPPAGGSTAAAPDLIPVPTASPQEDLVPEPGSTPGTEAASPGSLEPARVAPANAPRGGFFLDPLI